MKIGRRSDQPAAVGTPADGTQAGPVSRLPNRQERRKLKAIAGAKAPARAPRPRYELETVEPRLLMSADLSYATMNDTLTLSIGGTAAAPTVRLTNASGQLAAVSLTAATGTEIDISRGGIGGGAVSADTLNIDLTNFATLNTFVNANGGALTVKFDGGGEASGTPHPFTDTVNVNGASGTLGYGVTVDSTSAIASGATLTAKSITLASAQTASDLLSTGLFANADTGINLTGAHLTTTGGALTLNATSTLAVTTTGTGMSAVNGAVITSFSNATIGIGGASALKATGGDIDITASVQGTLTASASGATVKLVSIDGSASSTVTINGGSSLVSTTGAIDATASSNVTISATATPATGQSNAKVDAAVLNTTFGSGAAMTVNGGATLSAHTADTVAAASTLKSSTIANANVAGDAGASVAVSVITGDTTTDVDNASLTGSSVSATASSNRTIVTTATSSPGGSQASGSGSNASEQTLAGNNASTGTGQNITVAGAITVSTDTGATSAFLGNGATINAGTGAAKVSAASVDVVTLTSSGLSTTTGTNGVGVAVGINSVIRPDSAYVTGTVNVTAGSLDVAVLAPSQSSFTVSATSGVGNASNVGVAGALGVNVVVLDHEAYLDTNATLGLAAGNSGTTFETHSNVANTVKAIPANSGTPGSVGIGASVAVNYGQDTTNATVDNGAALTGAGNLTLTAAGAHSMLTDATGGGAGATGLTPVAAISVADNDTAATLGTGALLTIGGALVASSTLSNAVSTNAAGDTKSSKTGVGISLAMSFVNDHSTATTGRDVTSTGAASFLSTMSSGSESFATASVVGAAQSGGSGSVDSTASSEQGFANSTAASKAPGAKGTEGATPPSASTSDGQVSVAAGIAINDEQGTSKAFIADGRTITSGGILTVKSGAKVDGQASSSGAAVTNAATFAPAAVSTTADTINLGASTTLKTGDGVTYNAGSGAAIGGLTGGTKYFVNVVSGGTVKLYDTAAHATAGGATGLKDLTSTGSTGQFLSGGGSTGTSVGAAVSVNFVKDTNLAYLGGSAFKVGGLDVEATTPAQTISFNPATGVSTAANTINLGVTDLVTGDAVTYNTNGGTAIGGLTNGTTYYVNVQTNGTVRLYDSYADAVASGAIGLLTLTGAGSGSATMVSPTDNFGAYAVSGAGGGKTGVAGSLAISIADDDTEADLGYTQPGASPGVPVITVTGAGNVTLNAATATAVSASAVPSNGGGTGSNLGVGISASLDYAQTQTLAQITNGVALSGANNLTMSATSTQTMTTLTQGGAAGSTGVTPVIAIAITDNDTRATVGTGAAISLTGAFSAKALLTDTVTDSATGATQASDTGVGITVTVTVVNDDALATTARSLASSGAASPVTLSATILSSSSSTATASVAGGQQSSGSSGQTVNNTTAAQSGFGDSEVKNSDSGAMGTKGSDTNNKAQSGNGAVSVAGAVAVNVENGTALATIADGVSITAKGLLTVVTAAQVNGLAIATGAAKTNSGGTGVGLGVGVNVVNVTNQATIGNGTVISSGGLIVGANMAQRTIPLATSPAPVVNTTTDTVFLGMGTGLSNGDGVAYNAMGGTVIGGLASGTTYYVNTQGNGTFTLYTTAALAKAGGTSGRIDLTSTGGAGTQEFTQSQFGGLISNNFTFNPTGNVTLLTGLGLHTGDAVTYNNGGGTNMGGLTTATQYYVIDLTGGKYQLATSLDNALAGTAITLGAAGSSTTQSFVDGTDNFRADATSGGSGGNVGVSVSVGVNDITNNTGASVGDSAALAAPKVTITSGGAVSVTASSSEENFARALPSAGGAGGSSVGVGGSAGVNVVSNTTTATIIDGTSWAGSAGAVTVAATSSDVAFTHGENGAAGGSAAIGIGAAVAVVSDTTKAYVGTGTAIAASGNVAVTARDSGIFETTTNANAAGSSVAVGASVSVSVIKENVTAQTARSITTTGGTMSILSIVSIEDQTLATASTGGESSSDSQQNSNGKSGADGQADKQLNGNSDTAGSSLPSASSNVSNANGDSSGQGGGDSGGVGVAASVAVGVLTVNNAATVSGGIALSATGAVTVEASAGITDKTQAVGSSVALSSSTMIGAGVAVAVVNTTNNAEVGASSVTGNGIIIEAITPSTDTFVVWGASAAGGTGSASVAGSVAVNVVNTDNNQASAAGATLKSSGAITVQATNSLAIQTLAAAGAFSDGAGVGVAVTVGYLRATSSAFITGKSDAAGATGIDSKLTLTQLGITIPKNPVPLPAATAIAVVGAAGTSPTVAGSVIVDDFGLNSSAGIGASSAIDKGGYYAATAAQKVSVTAESTTPITGIAGALSATTGAAGVGASLDLELINKSTIAYVGGNSIIAAGGAVTVAATSSETMLSVTATLGVGSDAGIAATASIAPIAPTTEAYVAAGATVSAGGAMTIAATETFITTMIAGSVGVGSTAGVGAANTTLVYSPTTLAFAGTGATLTAGAGGLSVAATASENVLAITAGIAAGGTAGVAGSATVAVLNDTTSAYVGAGATVAVKGGGSLAVAASDSTGVISVAGNLAVGGTAGIGAGADVGVFTKHTNAYVGSGVSAIVTGNIAVLAQSSENLISVAAGIAGGTVGIGIDAGVHVFNLQTRAFIGDDPAAPANKGAGNVQASGSVSVAANDASDINEIVGVFAAGAVGVAGGAGVNVFTKDTEAFIGVGAKVTALGTAPTTTVDTGLLGISFGATTSTFNPTGSSSSQGISAGTPSTKSNALAGAASGNRAPFMAAGTVGTPSLGQMDLTGGGAGAMQSPGAGNQSLSPTTGNRQTVIGTQAGFSGVAVGATNQDEIRTFTVTLGAGSVAVAVSAGVDVVKANTQAYIGANAHVTAAPGGAGTQVLVGATDDFYHLSVGAGLAFGAVGVAPSVGVNVITDTTNASIGAGATVTATGNVSVIANGSENILLIGVGLAAGAVGVGAVVDVLSVSNNTTAAIGSAAIVHAGGNVLVAALDNTSVFELSGALAGGFVGVGGAVGVMEITKVTTATIGANANVEGLGNGAAASGILNGVIAGGAFQTLTANGVLVQAQSGETILQIVAAGGVGFVGVSGAVGVASLNITTNATIGSGAVINNANPAAANGNQSVFVDAADNFGFQVYVVGVAGGFVGVTGAVDVGTLADNVAAVIGTGARIYAKQSVDVGAAGLQALTGYVISGAGGFVGAGASVMDWSIGQALQVSYSDNSGHTAANGLANANGDPDANAGQQAQGGAGLAVGSGGIGGLMTAGTVNPNGSAGRINAATNTAGTMVNSAAPTKSSVLAMQSATPVNPGTSAVVQSGAQIHAGGAIGVIAEEQATVTEFLGTVAGGVVGIGAAVDILSFDDNVQASNDATSTAGANVFVFASLNSDIEVTALDLSAGFVGIGAGVVVVNDSSVVKATLGSVSTPGDVSVATFTTRTLNVTTGQASIGAVGAGATFTEVTMGGATTAAVDAGAVIGSVALPVDSLIVEAVATQDIDVQTTAVTAGIGAFGANFSNVTVNPVVDAAVGANAVIHATGAMSVVATSTTDADASTFGVSAGGLAVGMSFTDVTVAPKITAELDNGDNVSVASLNVGAASYLPASGWDANASATGSAGALIGVVSTNTESVDNDVVTSFIGSSAKIAAVGAVVITALNYTAQKSNSNSNAGGLIAAGLASSEADSNTTTNAYIGASTHITSGDLTLTATGDDNNLAHTNAGSGGLVAGASAEADTNNTSTTAATIGASDVIALSDTTVSPTTGFVVRANHEADFNGQISTFAGGLFAGTGGSETNKVTANTTATVGASATVTAYNIGVTAYDFANKQPLPGSGSGSVTPNIYGTTGGLVSGATASDVTTINFTTVVSVNSSAFLNALGAESNDPILQLQAYNNFDIYDDVAFETGGAFTGAGADATINVPTDIAKVVVNAGAALQSQGAILITARGGGSFDEELQTDTYGLGTYSGGTTTVNVAVTNQVVVGTNVLMTAYGNLDLGAGTDVFPNFDTYSVTTHNDGYAYSAVPISNVDANAFLTQSNAIAIGTGAVLKTAQEVYLTAQPDPSANMVSYADAINWATGLANGILSALGGGSPIVHGGTSKTTTTSSVVNNGTVVTGINSHLTLTLNNNSGWVSTDPISQAVTATTGSSPQITFSVGTQIPQSPLFAALQYDEQQLADYGAQNSALFNYYSGEVTRIENELETEGLLTVENNGSTTVLLSNAQPELEVTINPVYADAGVIYVHSAVLTGTGTFIAPNSASVSIINNSLASLNLYGIDISADQGGLWYNIGPVSSNATINGINGGGSGANFNLAAVANGPATTPPSIVIENTLNINTITPPAGVPLHWPDMTLYSLAEGGIGITNPNGSLLMEEVPPSLGNITLDGPVNVGTQTVITNGTLVISGVTDEEVGGAAYAAWNAITQGAYVGAEPGQTAGGIGPASASAINALLTTPPSQASGLHGASITINAQFIDVNGLIQSGNPQFDLTINASVTAEINTYLALGYTGLIYLPEESNTDFTVDYDTSTKQIDVTAVPVNGGYINLTGHIMDAQDGTIEVFGGYGTINVTNNSNFDIAIQNLDASTPGQGQLIVNDLTAQVSGSTTTTVPNFSDYTYSPDSNSILYENNPGGSASTTFTIVDGNTTNFMPQAGWRYGWTTVDQEEVTKQWLYTTSNWVGIIPTGSAEQANFKVVSLATPTVTPTGGYFFYEPSLTSGASNYNLNQHQQTIITDPGSVMTVSHSESSTWYGEHTYSALFQEKQGQETDYYDDVSASRPIAIDFLGGSTAQIEVLSTGTGNIYLDGAITNPHGYTTIEAEHGSIFSEGPSQVITGGQVSLFAGAAIGTAIAPVNVVAAAQSLADANANNLANTQGITAVAQNGGIYLDAPTGSMYVDEVSALTRASTGDINTGAGRGVFAGGGQVVLTAADNILPTGYYRITDRVKPVSYVFVPNDANSGLVLGGAITLTAGFGEIGDATTAEIQIGTSQQSPGLVDTITATAAGNVFLQQKTGNMEVNSISTTGGNVWLNVPNGSVLNANTNSTTDTRTEEQLIQGVWSDLGLTDATGYQQKLNTTLASYASAQDAQYQTYWQDIRTGATSGAAFAQLQAIYGVGGTYAAQDAAYNPLVYNGSAALISAPVYFTAGTASTGGTITRTDGGNWIAQGFAVGQAITLTGSAANATTAGETYMITAVTGTKITLAVQDIIVTEGTAGAPETVTLQHTTTDGQDAVSGYFTASTATTRGQIVRNDGGNWLTDGFALGQTILVAGSAGNSTSGATAYTVVGITSTVLALSLGDAIVAEATAAAPEAFTVQHIFAYKMTTAQTTTLTSHIRDWTPAELLNTFSAGLLKSVTDTVITVSAPNITGANVTILTANSVGEQVGGAVTIPLSYAPNPPTVLTAAQSAALAAAERVDVQYLAAAPIAATVNFTANTITRTDGGNWTGLLVGEYISVLGTNGVYTQNETDGTLFYKIDAISGGKLTIDASTPLPAIEAGMSVTVAPIVLNPLFQASAAPVHASVYFTPNTATGGGTITRTDGQSWIAQGFAVGKLVEITGSANDSTSPDVADVITGVTATTLTLTREDLIVHEATAAAPETITLTLGVAPKPVAIQITQIKPIEIEASGVINITAAESVFVNSTVDVRIGQVTAGTTTVGAQIQIKTQSSILDGQAGATSPTPNLQGGELVLEASGENGDPGIIGTSADMIRVASIGAATITARAEGSVNLEGVILKVSSGGVLVNANAGNLNLETVYSATGDVNLLAQGSILSALDNGFTTIKADNVSLLAVGTIGNIVGGAINYVYLDNPGTVRALSFQSMWISEGDLVLSYEQNLNLVQAYSFNGGVTLRAGLSILDASDTPGTPDIEGTQVTLNSVFGGIGLAGDPITILKSTVLTASAGMGDIHIEDTTGDVTIASITDAGGSVYLTDDAGSILNGAGAGVTDIVALNAVLTAQVGIGSSSTTRVTTQVSALEATSTTGDTLIDNTGALTIGGSFSTSGTGIVAGGSAVVTTTGALRVENSVIAQLSVELIAQNAATNGNVTFDGLDLLSQPLLVESAGAVLVFAGDGIAVQQHSSIKSGIGVLMQSDYQGDLNGSTPLNPGPSKFATTGTAIQIAGLIAGPYILVRGGDGPDRIGATGTSVLTAAYPWSSATYPTQFGTFPTTHSGSSVLQVSGYAGNDAITLGGSITAGNVDLFGGDGADTITFSTTNAQTGVDAIFGDNGTVNYANPSIVTGLATSDDGVGGNDIISIGAAANPADAVVFGGEGANRISMAGGQGFVFGGDGIMSYTSTGALTEASSAAPDVVGNNTLNLGAASVVAFGGSGSSTITAGAGSSFIFGHEGQAYYGSAGGPIQYIETIAPTDGTSTNIKVNDGASSSNIIMGGNGAGTIAVGNGTDTIIGHNGFVTFAGRNLSEVAAIFPAQGGNETITMGSGNDTVIGGSGSNTITGVSGNDIVAGDNASILYDANGNVSAIISTDVVTSGGSTTSYGGANTIKLGNGNNLVVGGVGANSIAVGNGNNSIITADGSFALSNGVLASAQTLNPGFAGADTVQAGTGRNVVIGGVGNDTITLAASTTYAVLGGPGSVTYDAAGWANTATLTAPATTATTGTDKITLGTATSTLSGTADIVVSGLGTPQFAAAAPPAGHVAAPALTERELEPVVVEAEAIWARVLGADRARLAILNGITIDIAQLSGGLIGLTQGDTITIDSTADGWGWFTDTGHAGDEAFARSGMPGVLSAQAGSAAAGEMDLLSTVLHEMGNAMGFPEDTGQDVTGNVLAAGERRLPVAEPSGGAALGLPAIAWGTVSAAEPNVPSNPAAPVWADDFLNNLGRGASDRQPNAGFRIKLG